jgi:hypothetical protein
MVAAERLAMEHCPQLASMRTRPREDKLRDMVCRTAWVAFRGPFWFSMTAGCALTMCR